MTINKIREKYLKFFESRGHTIISPAPLVLENDPTTLFTSSGMQPLVPYLLGEKHPEGVRLVDSQPSIRTQDIEEVGDNRHTTFFEMLGNWSLGDYFKKEQLPWIWEFLTKDLSLPKEKLYVSIFEGDDSVPRDEESYEIWKSLGVSTDHIFEYGVKKNWWSRSGVPENMPEGEIGGPDSEIFFDFGKELGLHEQSEWKDEECHPNCDCGRFLEIGNSVFIQYVKRDGKLVELPQKNVDFGGGLERMAAAVNNNPDVFKIDVFAKMTDTIEKISNNQINYNEYTYEFRIILDHIRASAFLIKEGVIPSNKQQGYMLRRLIRRAAIKVRKIGFSNNVPALMHSLTATLVSAYEGSGYFEYKEMHDQLNIADILLEEVKRFNITLEKGLKEIEKMEKIDGKIAFDLYQTYGFPLEITEEIFEDRGQKIDHDQFQQEFEHHKELSRSASAGVFKGGLADHSAETTRLHTATHLLHQALRTVLGDHVQQKGSNITVERLRFDFVHDKALTKEEIESIETLMNQQIDKKLAVTKEFMTLKQARESGALAFFNDKYDEQVSVYSIGDFSREVCGGPHVSNLSELGGHVTIMKEQSASAGVRRIYAKIV